MSDAYGQQREARPRQRSFRPPAVPNAAPGADDHLDEETSAAFALGALDGPERELVEFHVRFCPRCAATVERDLRTTGMLPFLAAPAVPAPDVKAALFARIGHAERAVAATTLVELTTLAPTPTITLPSSRPEAPTTPLFATEPTPAPAASRSLGWVGSVLSVPLLVALVATGFWGFQMREQLQTQGSRVSALEAQVANFGSMTTYQLSPGMGMPQAEGKLLLGANEQAGILEVDLNSDEAAGTYVVWGYDENGQYRPITELEVGPDGTGSKQFDLSQPYSSYESVQIVPKALNAGAADESAVLQIGNPSMGSTGTGAATMP